MNLSDGVVTIDVASNSASATTANAKDTARMHVLHVLPSLDPRTGGVAEAVVQLVNHMPLYGCTGEVVTLDAPGASAFDRIHGTVHGLGPGCGFYGLSARLMRWLRAHADRFDAIIVHGIWQFHSIAARCSVLGKRTPLFVFPHGMLDPWFQRTYPAKHVKKLVYWSLAEQWVFRRANAVLFTCQAELELAREPFLDRGLPLRVSGFGIEPVPQDGSASEAFWNTYPSLRGKRMLLYLSRIHEKKGCDLLIDAFARVAVQHPDVYLVIAGPGESALVDRLKGAVRRRRLDAQVIWTGMLTGPIKWAAMRAAEAFVLPSHQENFGIAVVEALASGTPVLITDRVNIWQEIVVSGGGLVCVDTLEGVTDMLRRWCAQTSPGERDAMRANAVECYRKHFRIEAAARRLTEIVSEERRPRLLSRSEASA